MSDHASLICARRHIAYLRSIAISDLQALPLGLYPLMTEQLTAHIQRFDADLRDLDRMMCDAVANN